MTLAKTAPATCADLEALPAHMVGEIVHGVLYAHPRPAPRQMRAAGRLGAELDGPFDRGNGGPVGWIILDEPELHLGGHVLVPDIAGWRIERLPDLPETAFIETAPDWVCEVLSPSTMQLDRVENLPLYGQLGVGHTWLLDPLARTLEVYALAQGKWLPAATFGGSDPVTASPFQAHTFPLDALWRWGSTG